MLGGDMNNRFKILLIGDQSVGKTCLFQQFSDNSYEENQISTIGVEFKHLKVTIEDNKEIYFTLWDTAGQERFRSITKNYYKGAHGFLLIYDVTCRQTLEGTHNWLKSIRENSKLNVKIILIGNKIDLEPPKRVVSTEEGRRLAQEYNCLFYETSTKSNINVTEVMKTIIKSIYDQELISKEREEKERKRLESLKKETPPKKGCCLG